MISTSNNVYRGNVGTWLIKQFSYWRRKMDQRHLESKPNWHQWHCALGYPRKVRRVVKVKPELENKKKEKQVKINKMDVLRS